MLPQCPGLAIQPALLSILISTLLDPRTEHIVLVVHPFFKARGTEPAVVAATVVCRSMRIRPRRPGFVGRGEERGIADVSKERDELGSLK